MVTWSEERIQLALTSHSDAAALEFAPAKAGVITVSQVTRTYQRWGEAPRDVTEWHNEVLRDPVDNPDARKLTDAEFLLLLRLGVMRMWSRRNIAKSAAETPR